MRKEQDLAAFVAARGPALLRLAWLLTADGQAAEDLVQDALARAVPRWGSIGAGFDVVPDETA
jgi:DNA-directed RNA polymerase specialized sigma24 family protein